MLLALSNTLPAIRRRGIIKDFQDYLNRTYYDYAYRISDADAMALYDELPALVKSSASMLFAPTAFKAGKIYSVLPRVSKNLILYSERFGDASWTKTNTTLVANAVANPLDGAVTADLLYPTSTGLDRFARQRVTVGGSRSYTISVYAKAAGLNFLLFADINDTVNNVWFNLSNGTVSSPSVGSASIESIGNGWYRCSATATTTTSTGTFYMAVADSSGSRTATTSGTNGIYIYGAQLEEGSSATTYVGTNISENLFKYSEQFDNAIYSKNISATVTANSITAPDGTTTADTLSFPAGGGYIYQQVNALTVGQVYTYSVWLRCASGTFATNISRTDTSTWSTATISAITVTTTWQRFTLTFTHTNINSHFLIGYEGKTPTNTQTGDIYAWGMQLNYGSTALPYAKTTYSNTDGWVNYADFSFSRASNAMMVGRDGLLQYAPHNLLVQSESFDNASWSKSGGTSVAPTVTANQDLAPDGTITADRVVFPAVSAAGAWSQLFQSATLVSGQVYTASIWLKGSVGGEQLYLHVTPDGVTYARQLVTLTTSWQRYIFTYTPTWTSGSFILGVDLRDGSQTSKGAQTVYAWGAQLNVGPRLLDYVQTTSAAIYGPRFNYNPVTLKYEGLLMEKASTNLFQRSEEFDNVYWDTLEVTTTANQAIAPDGTLTADLISESNTSFAQGKYKFLTYSATAYTLSMFFKKGTQRYVTLSFTNRVSGNGSFAGKFDLQTGTTIVADPGVTANVTSFGNGWYRCAISATLGAFGDYAEFWTEQDGTTTITRSAAASGKTLYVWGAQLEASSVPTSYIPTLGATVTRAAETCLITGASNLANWYNEDEGVLYAAGRVVNSENNSARYVQIDKGADTDFITVAQVGASCYLASAAQADITTSRTVDNKSAFAFKRNDFAFAKEGALIGTDSSGNVLTDTTTIRIGYALSTGTYLNGTIKTIAYFNTRRTNAELQQITT